MVRENVVQALDLQGEDVGDVVEVVQVLRHQLLQSPSVQVARERGKGGEGEGVRVQSATVNFFVNNFTM